MGPTNIFGAHTPSAHVESAHEKPHRPQFLVSVEKSASQPASAALSQSPNPGRHVISHAELTHAACLAPCDPHTLPHSPQFLESVRTSTSQPSEATWLQSRR